MGFWADCHGNGGSWFGYEGDPVSCAAYDLCILEEIEKEEEMQKEKKRTEHD